MGFFSKKKKVKDIKEDVLVLNNTYVGNQNNLSNLQSMTNISCKLIAHNPYLEICSKACSICWGKQHSSVGAEQLNYLSKRIKTGHYSILEHSNLVFLIECTLDVLGISDLFEFLPVCKFMNIKIKKSKEVDNKYYIVLGGSIRGIYNILDKLDNPKRNAISKALIQCLYETSYRDFFIQYIECGIMDDMFISNIPDITNKSAKDNNNFTSSIDIEDILTIENVDSIDYLLSKINNETENLFLLNDMLDMVTITVLFKNMSRVITQQLVRHRNAITQESQRYVNYSKTKFNSPAKYNPNRYNNTEIYKIKFKNHLYDFTLQSLGDEIKTIYMQLINQKAHEKYLLKEDARGYLPGFIQCNKLYMTFTLRNLFSFFNLRCDKSAQAEIRYYAIKLRDWWDSSQTLTYNEDYLKPKALYNEIDTYDNVDEKL